MVRLSRQETQQVTRQRLVEAAEREILRVGIFEASIRQICETAGFTLGAFYSNFKNKDELLLEVVALQTKREFETLNKLALLSAGSKQETVLAEITAWLRQLQKNKILSACTLEFEVYANHNPAFRKKYTQNKRDWHNEVAKALESLFAGLGLVPRIPLSQMAVGFSALWVGFIVEGRVPDAETADVVIPHFLEALLESSR